MTDRVEDTTRMTIRASYTDIRYWVPGTVYPADVHVGNPHGLYEVGIGFLSHWQQTLDRLYAAEAEIARLGLDTMDPPPGRLIA